MKVVHPPSPFRVGAAILAAIGWNGPVHGRDLGVADQTVMKRAHLADMEPGVRLAHDLQPGEPYLLEYLFVNYFFSRKRR